MSSDSNPEHVVILVHGIRDYALWQTSVRSTLLRQGLKVEAINYGRFNLLEFLAPFPFFRKRAIDTVWNQIRIIRQNHKNSLISVIAHSFGTFVIANLMSQEFDMRFHRVIFCGSVVPYQFPFEQFQERFSAPIINEVGTRDVWPALAESITVGYGSAGTYGFRRPLVIDRWHNGAHHGFFLNSKFCDAFWTPILKDGIVSQGAEEPEKPKAWLQIVSIVKLKNVFVLFTALICLYAFQRLLFPPIAVPDPNSVKTVEELKTALKVLEIQKANFDASQIQQISSDLTKSLLGNESTIDRVKRRDMNELVVATLVYLNDQDLSFAWRELPEDLDLSHLDLSGVNLRGVRFRKTFLIYTDFTNSKLDDAIFDDAWVRNVDFTGSSLSTTVFYKTDWFNAINLPVNTKDGRPVQYQKWHACPAGYKSIDRQAFIKVLEQWYIIKLAQIKKEDVDDLLKSWKTYVAGGICDLARG